MVLPATVTGSWSDQLNAKHGPFQIGTALYVVTVDKTANVVKMMKSTDGGSTWTEMDSANHPVIYATAANKSISAQVLSTSVYVAYIIGGAPQLKVVNSFDTTTDLWGTATGGTVAPAVSDTSQAAFVLGVRAAGSYVVAYQAPTATIMGTAYRRVSLQRYVSSAWQAAQAVDGGGATNYDLREMVGPDSSGRCHIFYAASTSTTTLYWKTLLAANTLSVEASFANGRTNAAYDVGNGAVNGSEIILLYTGQFSTANILRGTTGDTLSLAATSLASGSGENVTANPGALAVSGSTVYAFVIDAPTDDLYRNSDGGTNTWGARVAQEATITCLGVNANAVTSAIGILFNDNGTVKYDEYSLAVAGGNPVSIIGLSNISVMRASHF